MSHHDTPTADDAPFTAEEIELFRQLLVEKRRQLGDQQAGQLSALRGDGRHHLADLEEMGDSSDTDSLCEIMDLSASTLESIERALGKISEGSFGFCEDCSQPIRRRRLQVLPFATLCVDCQRRAEVSKDLATRPHVADNED